MTAHSQNGWPASPSLLTRTIKVDGIPFRVVDNRDAETVFTYILTQYAGTVEPLHAGQCFGYNYRPNVNNPNVLSNHSSATALDVNSLLNPNGVDATDCMSAAQIDACHTILASIPELAEVVHWGGDWHRPSLTPDPMHWELHDHDLAKLARVADRIREAADDMPNYLQWSDADRKALAGDVAKATVDLLLKAPLTKAGDSVKKALRLAAGLPKEAE